MPHNVAFTVLFLYPIFLNPKTSFLGTHKDEAYMLSLLLFNKWLVLVVVDLNTIGIGWSLNVKHTVIQMADSRRRF